MYKYPHKTYSDRLLKCRLHFVGRKSKSVKLIHRAKRLARLNSRDMLVNKSYANTEGNNKDVILSFSNLYQKLEDKTRDAEFEIFCDQKIDIHAGDFVSILGPSGCGKTTLLTLLGLLRRPFATNRLGNFTLSVVDQSEQRDTIDLKEAWRDNDTKRLEKIRAKEIGFALQSGELLKALTVKENIAVPMNLNGFSTKEIQARVSELISAFGLSEIKSTDKSTGKKIERSRVHTLSGGEYQRVVLARAIAHRPRLVFVDEPTAALNRELARKALSQLKSLLRDKASVGSAVVMITHDETLAKEFSTKIIRMEPLKNKPAGKVAGTFSNQPRY